ncbi:sensor histidine kinase [Uliginosibacterium sp. H1]|uniref:sensor histidine kinase n=1 Tax=Uliginosibacterium sp. H1 TaxID=3114757 RepID=UPI002E1863BA|nr:ATP-binding protein [Uliginosibacterium sp. H1]
MSNPPLAKAIRSDSLAQPPQLGPMPKRMVWGPEHVWLVGCTLLLLATLGASTTWFAEHDGFRSEITLLSLIAFVIATAFVIKGWRIDAQMRRDMVEMQRRYQDMFGRAGVSIWQEDWSAVAEAIQALRKNGVEDIVGWYRDRPDEARALHAQVLITDVNLHGCYLMRADNPSRLIGKLHEVVPGSFASFPRWLAAFCSEDRVYVGENRVRRLDGEAFDCYVTAAIPSDQEGYRQIMVSMLEITEYKRDAQKLAKAQEDLSRAQRIVTAGTLAATLAHEINSPLAAVAANSAACLRWLDRDPPDLREARDAAQAAVNAIERTQTVVAHTKSYFTRAKGVSSEIDLRSLINDTAVLFENEAIRHGVAVTLLVDHEIRARCNPIQIQQALVNLCINSIQAMSESGHPRLLTIHAGRDRKGAAVTVTDTGPGIPPAVLEEIFDPFFSTKGDGMGLGLAIARSCIEAHGGWVEVRSEVGVGTEFKITLPVGTP